MKVFRRGAGIPDIGFTRVGSAAKLALCLRARFEPLRLLERLEVRFVFLEDHVEVV